MDNQIRGSTAHLQHTRAHTHTHTHAHTHKHTHTPRARTHTHTHTHTHTTHKHTHTNGPPDMAARRSKTSSQMQPPFCDAHCSPYSRQATTLPSAIRLPRPCCLPATLPNASRILHPLLSCWTRIVFMPCPPRLSPASPAAAVL